MTAPAEPFTRPCVTDTPHGPCGHDEVLEHHTAEDPPRCFASHVIDGERVACECPGYTAPAEDLSPPVASAP